MDQNLKDIVKEKYAAIVTQSEKPCCGPSCCPSELEMFFQEDYTQQEGYVPEADYGLGCGIPTEYARIRPGDTVLDLGSGAGNDVFVARSLTGETGKVIGVDMTEAMIAKANANKVRLGYTNVEFLPGDIEDLPLADQTIDVAISNCVMNLVPDKAKAYREVYRVLRPGGHFSISDVVLIGELPPSIRQAAELYVGCVAGALPKEHNLDLIKAAGFASVKVLKEKEIHLPEELLLQYLSAEELKELGEQGVGIFSVTLYGEKAVSE